MGHALAGWTVVVTRDEAPNGPLGRLLAADGARVVHVPTVTIGPPRDATPLRAALARIHSYDWIVLTSPRAVDAIVEWSPALGGAFPSSPSAARPEVAVVGRATADRASAEGIPTDVIGSGEGGEALARELVDRGIGPGTEVFFPASSRAGRGLVEILEAAGATVEQVVAYETRTRTVDFGRYPGVAGADAVTFTSPSAVEGWFSSAGEGDPWGGRDDVLHVAIGSTTAAALEAGGLTPVVAVDPSLDGVVAAIRERAVDRGR